MYLPVAPPAKQKKVNEPEELSAEDQLEDSRAEDRLRQVYFKMLLTHL